MSFNNGEYNISYRGKLGNINLNTLIKSIDNGYYEVSDPMVVSDANNYPPLNFSADDLQMQEYYRNPLELVSADKEQYRFSYPRYKVGYELNTKNDYSYYSKYTYGTSFLGSGIYNLPTYFYSNITFYHIDSSVGSFFGVDYIDVENRFRAAELAAGGNASFGTITFQDTFLWKANKIFYTDKDFMHTWIPYKPLVEVLEHYKSSGAKPNITGVLEILSDNDLTIQTFHRFPDESTWIRSYDAGKNKWSTWAAEVPSYLEHPDNSNEFENGTITRDTKFIHNNSYETEIEIDTNIEGITHYEESSDPYRSMGNYDVDVFKYKDISVAGKLAGVRDDYPLNTKLKVKMGIANKYDERNLYFKYKGTQENNIFDRALSDILREINQDKNLMNSFINHHIKKPANFDTIYSAKMRKYNGDYPHNNSITLPATSKAWFNNIVFDDSQFWNGLFVNHESIARPVLQVLNYTKPGANISQFVNVFNLKVDSRTSIHNDYRPLIRVNGEKKGHLIARYGYDHQSVKMTSSSLGTRPSLNGTAITTDYSMGIPKFIEKGVEYDGIIPVQFIVELYMIGTRKRKYLHVTIPAGEYFSRQRFPLTHWATNGNPDTIGVNARGVWLTYTKGNADPRLDTLTIQVHADGSVTNDSLGIDVLVQY